MDPWRCVRDRQYEHVRRGISDNVYCYLDTRPYDGSYDGSVIVEKAISFGVLAVYASMNYW